MATKYIDGLKDFHPANRREWRQWLTKNCDSSPGVWFVYYKKASGKPRVTYDEAVEEALCFGWIDSLPRKLDAERSKLLFTPRKPKSGWSKLNKQRIKRLLENNLMTAAGLKKIEAAKLDGSWEKLDRVEDLKMPPELEKAFAADKIAAKNFAKFSDGVKKQIFWFVESAKRTETKQKRVEKVVSLAAENKKPY